LGNVGHNVITATWLHLTKAVPLGGWNQTMAPAFFCCDR
jgi:hypothetical protein